MKSLNVDNKLFNANLCSKITRKKSIVHNMFEIGAILKEKYMIT